jgi:hypothetical protein
MTRGARSGIVYGLISLLFLCKLKIQLQERNQNTTASAEFEGKSMYGLISGRHFAVEEPQVNYKVGSVG